MPAYLCIPTPMAPAPTRLARGRAARITPADLWSACARGDSSAREQLLAEHLGLVHFIARQVFRNLSTEADIGELVSSGTIGLMTALEGYDATRGIAFSTYATPRIRGAMLDELRRQDHVPRSVRRKTRAISRARETLMRELVRVPNAREIAARLGVDVDTLWRWQADVEGATVVPLERAPKDGEGQWGVAETLFDADAVGADDRISLEGEINVLKGALARLGKQDRTVLSLYYYEDLKLHEIAAILGLTESRISQVRSRALTRLRMALQPLHAGVA
jgi:RNA polymerase sigma factor for flagellar operon FliA